MPGLREIYVKFGGAAADLEYVSRIGVVSNHPSNPIINVQLVDSGSLGDKSTRQKQQDEIPEEKPDEYDKTLEIPADKRKDGSWYTYTYTFTPHSDGYQWTKCGQEKINSSAFPRCYYRCSYHRERSCPATKLVQQQHSDGDGDPTMYLVIYVKEHRCHHAAQAEPEEATAGSAAAYRLDFSAGLSRQQRGGISGIVLDRGAKEELEQQAIACLRQGCRCYSGTSTPEESSSLNCTGDDASASAVSLDVMDYDVTDTAYWHAEATYAFIPRQESQDFTVHGSAPAATASPDATLAPGTASARRPRDEGVPRKRTVTSSPHSDGYQWRKYGQKRIMRTSFPRCYYRCCYHRERSCPASKLVQQQHSDGDPTMYEVIYVHEHTCHNTAPAEPEVAARSSTPDALGFSGGLSRQQRDDIVPEAEPA